MRISQIKTAYTLFKEQGWRSIIQVMAKNISHSQPQSTLPEATNQYIRLLKFANAGMMSRGNTNCFDYAIKNIPSGAPIVEVGSFLGLSANTISYLKAKHNKINKLITCDKWQIEEFYKGNTIGDHSNITFPEYNKYLKENFMTNIKMFSKNDLPYTIEMYSDDFFAVWEKSILTKDILNRDVQLGGPISFCYIDGNHSYEFSATS